ncbi:MAG: carbohydrate kinase family protein [Candidatus Goldbacteria bacterium]|nr:carbohydrate kinase family protein [Candidatus Goldiibacteriota bacterium]
MTKVLCVGTLVVDIFAQGLDSAVAPNTGFKSRISHHPGGNVLNVAIDLSKLGVKNVICGSVTGDDMFGNMLAGYLEKYKIKSRVKIIKNGQTAKCFILGFDDKSRAFIGDKGSNPIYTAAEVIKLIKKEKPAIFYAGETPSMPNVESGLMRIMETAKKSGAITVLDYIISSDKFKGNLLKCGKFTDILHVNDYEAGLITGKKDVREALKFLTEAGFKFAVITCGGGNTVFSYNGKTYDMAVLPVKCVDSTGAGDAFTAGIIAKLSKLKGKTVKEKIKDENTLLNTMLFASACGALAVTQTGCTGGVSAKKANELLKKYGKKFCLN